MLGNRYPFEIAIWRDGQRISDERREESDARETFAAYVSNAKADPLVTAISLYRHGTQLETWERK